MMTELHLTAAETKLFNALPSELQDGWTVVEETQKFEDTDRNVRTRISIIRLKDPKLNAFKEQVKNAKDQNEVANLISEFDLQNVAQPDLAKLFFALGTEPLSKIIQITLPKATTDKDIENVAALSLIRNALLRSFINNYS
ncbi:hypothetical protein HN512_05140 [Candidatus Peregrinibacteria bacterium]|nr:hypothetical protein [Candidatus Peregrinibacteria bacterium]MBT3599191.1 hypothetical protein [Candidatus Peregrinibacteria bacterium]MBT6730905.1 hypothetical protein [Candidatus Peregrinibacteria bacterium]MBT7009365.1 hypothetical protein [Candidatus Peregrinibacteria bacterium]MBT7345438.1 hypothetical protein [Candidatus Peregrinibacteria bacterium]